MTDESVPPFEPNQEHLSFLLAQLEIRCDKCEMLAPEGLGNHDCANPSPQPPEAELL